jgi:TolB-like protein
MLRETSILLLLTFTVTFLVGPVLAQADAPTVSVLDLRAGEGITADQSLTLTDWLVGELDKTGSFIIVNRSERDARLSEIGFQMTGACDDATCVADVGAELGVVKMVAGSIGLIGQTWTVTAQLVDVETARTDRTSSHSHAGSIDGLLDVLGDVARELAGGRRDVVIRPGDTGTIVVTSTPAGATISVDGVEKGATPVSAEVSAGMHAVTASYPGYRSETKGVYVEAGGWVPVTIDMAKLAGNVRVITDPAGALVRVNGVLRGESSETGLVITDLPSGQTHISATKEGRKDASTTVEVVGGEETRVELKLKRKKSLWEYALYATGALMVLSLVTLIATGGSSDQTQ